MIPIPALISIVETMLRAFLVTDALLVVIIAGLVVGQLWTALERWVFGEEIR